MDKELVLSRPMQHLVLAVTANVSLLKFFLNGFSISNGDLDVPETVATGLFKYLLCFALNLPQWLHNAGQTEMNKLFLINNSDF